MSESPLRSEPDPSESRHDSPPKSSPPKSSALNSDPRYRHVYTRRRSNQKTQINQGMLLLLHEIFLVDKILYQYKFITSCKGAFSMPLAGEDMGPVKEEREPIDGGASQAARSSVGPDSDPTPPDDQTIRDTETGSPPLWRLSLGTGSSPTCQPPPASPPAPRTIRLLGFDLPAMAPPPPSEQPQAAADGASAISKVLIVMGKPNSPLHARLVRHFFSSYGFSVCSSLRSLRGCWSGLVAAMGTEAMPLVNKFRLVEAPAHETIFGPPPPPPPPSPFFSFCFIYSSAYASCSGCDFVG
jgi:hypothetical protein